jgi:hypothetical protein
MLAVAGLTTIGILAQPSSWFTSTYPTDSLPKLEELVARNPGIRILADVRYADWMIWENPRVFSGRVAYDTSFELLSSAQLRVIADLAARDARTLVGAYRLWMLYPGNHTVNRVLLRQPGVVVLSRSRKLVIAMNSRAPS